MKVKILVVSMLVVVLTLAFSTSVALADKPAEPVGERLDLSAGPTEWSAGEPFHVTHGFYAVYWINEPIGNAFAFSKMTLEVDGVEVEVANLDTEWGAYPQLYNAKYFAKFFTFNFPDGLAAGEHTFVRRYYFTCQSYLFAGELLECYHPKELIEDPGMMETRVVNFE